MYNIQYIYDSLVAVLYVGQYLCRVSFDQLSKTEQTNPVFSFVKLNCNTKVEFSRINLNKGNSIATDTSSTFIQVC